MTEKDLKSIKYLKIEIERDSKILQEIRKDNSEEYRRVLTENREKLLRKKAEVEKLVNDIEDDEIRLIFKMKFIDFRSWNYIAKIMHYDRTTVYKKYQKYIREMSNEK